MSHIIVENEYASLFFPIADKNNSGSFFTYNSPVNVFILLNYEVTFHGFF